MKKHTKFIAAGAIAVAAVGAGVAGAVTASGGDDTDTPITGTALDQASSAALAHTGKGGVTGTEVGDEDSFYEIEVTFDDGRQVDVQLDEGFNVVKTMTDQDTGADAND